MKIANKCPHGIKLGGRCQYCYAVLLVQKGNKTNLRFILRPKRSGLMSIGMKY